ncbi:MAG: SRPBCC domain-containing protein [Actinobacteria bacterium]|nr:SRPBCC domain-containing protein [Actinomycetota bacterium]
MTVISVDADYDSLTIALIADFDSPVDQVWELWSDPRKLERWWGPPGYPATFEKHALTPGGEVTYSMTGPEGELHRGMWRVTSVDPPTSLQFTDAFADSSGAPLEDSPVSEIGVRLLEHEGGTRMEMRMTFETREDMDRLVDLGAVEGLEQAVGQMDGLLAT